jgi:alcohol dehydrogenase
MKAFILDRYGKGERLRLGEMPEPELKNDDVLVEVHAAGVNPLDSKIRDGAFKLLLLPRPSQAQRARRLT